MLTVIHLAVANMLVYIICFIASLIGSICGIGGGIIIKPALDALGLYSVNIVSFLSACTVLAMTAYSVISLKISGERSIDNKRTLPLALGAAFGGILGKWGFVFISSFTLNKGRVGAIQAFFLFLMTLLPLLYVIYKEKIKTKNINSSLACALVGFLLGLVSAFLGIGGGATYLVLLIYLFSMSTKVAVENSLYVIFVSQVFSILYAYISGSIPKFEIFILLFMIFGGISGGIVGRILKKKLTDKMVEKLFIIFMIIMLVINIFNIYKFIF